jgi:hypothetical protein
LFRDPTDLQKRLLHLLADPARGRAIGDAARGMVAQERMLARQVPQRLAWYRSLWARRDELHRALLERVPALATPPIDPMERLPAEGTALTLPPD